jgi:hypothetical protein
MHICTKCSQQLIDLPASKQKSLQHLCLNCRADYKRTLSDKKKRYYKEVIVNRRKTARESRNLEKAKEKEQKKIIRLNRHKEEKSRQYQSEWRKRNRGKNKEYQKKNIDGNLNARFGLRLRTLVYISLRTQLVAKGLKTTQLTGCSIEQLQKHLEGLFLPGMNWKNHCRDGWHIDHIIPCSVFDLTDPEQQKKCFHYSNLQPLWAKDNISKSNKIIAV